VDDVISYWSGGDTQPLRDDDGSRASVVADVEGHDDQVEDRVAEQAPATTPRRGVSGGRKSAVVDVELGAFAGVFHEVGDTIEEDPFRADSIALPITMVPLIVVVGSGAAAWLSALVGVNSVVGTFLVLPVLAALTDVSMYALILTTALGLGLAIDCSLFVVSRYREELRAGYAPRIAASRTTRTVGFSALTVAESLLAGLVFPVRVPAQRRRRGRRSGATGQAVLGDGAAGDPRAAGPSDEGADRVAPLGDPPEEGVWRRIATVVTRGPNPIATAVVDAVPGLPNQIDAYATQLATLPAVTRVAAATGTYRGTESATQVAFNVDGATDLSLIPWDSGGRQ
jgi:putative drug exporter of the RND superfamily